jgi:ABC-type uncharacterized transport system permease subunit
MDPLGTFVAAAATATTPILVTAIGGAFADRARATNIAMEGMMLVAAFFALAVTSAMGDAWVGLAAGVGMAVVLALGLAFVVYWLGCDLFIAGIGLNLLASGLTLLLLEVVYNEPGTYTAMGAPSLPKVRIRELSDLPIVGGLFGNQSIVFWIVVAIVVIAQIVMTRTRFGFWVRATGENEDAAAAAGISVLRVRVAALVISGACAGIGGAYLSIAALNVFATDMTAGRGFIALAAILAGGATILGTTFWAVLFGIAAAAAIRFQTLAIPKELVLMLPYVATIVALAIFGFRRWRTTRWSAADIGYVPPILPRG